MSNEYPTISIVTPNWNGARFLEDTIKSVVNQNYPNLEYIIIDGGSTDKSVDIIRNYDDRLSYWQSKSDKGLYYALNRGFEKSTGEIMGWLNSDDMLHPNSLFTLAEIFQNQEIEWLQGVHSWFDEKGRVYQVEKVRLRSKYNYLLKHYHQGFSPFIQQESTYWRRSLWNKSGGYISTKYHIAGDFELWMRFFKNAELFLTNSLIGGFRYSGTGQFSIDNSKKYIEEADCIIDEYKLSEIEKENITFLKSKSFLDKVPYFRRNRYLKRNLLLNKPSQVNWDPNKRKFIIQ
jgi:glycosyltransferase involved in cell wall biosynthesis